MSIGTYRNVGLRIASYPTRSLAVAPLVPNAYGWEKQISHHYHRIREKARTSITSRCQRPVFANHSRHYTTSHLIYASAELGSSRDRAFRESSQRIARNGLPSLRKFCGQASSLSIFQRRRY